MAFKNEISYLIMITVSNNMTLSLMMNAYTNRNHAILSSHQQTLFIRAIVTNIIATIID